MTQMTQTTQICADQDLFAANEKFTGQELFFGFWLLLLFGHASGGAAIPGRAAVEEAVGVTNKEHNAGGDEDDDQKMLSPQWH